MENIAYFIFALVVTWVVWSRLHHSWEWGTSKWPKKKKVLKRIRKREKKKNEAKRHQEQP